MMYLYARTNIQGSEQRVSLGLSCEEWNDLTQEMQDDIVQEYLGNLIETWVEDVYEK